MNSEHPVPMHSMQQSTASTLAIIGLWPCRARILTSLQHHPQLRVGGGSAVAASVITCPECFVVQCPFELAAVDSAPHTCPCKRGFGQLHSYVHVAMGPPALPPCMSLTQVCPANVQLPRCAACLTGGSVRVLAENVLLSLSFVDRFLALWVIAAMVSSKLELPLPLRLWKRCLVALAPAARESQCTFATLVVARSSAGLTHVCAPYSASFWSLTHQHVQNPGFCACCSSDPGRGAWLLHGCPRQAVGGEHCGRVAAHRAWIVDDDVAGAVQRSVACGFARLMLGDQLNETLARYLCRERRWSRGQVLMVTRQLLWHDCDVCAWCRCIKQRCCRAGPQSCSAVSSVNTAAVGHRACLGLSMAALTAGPASPCTTPPSHSAIRAAGVHAGPPRHVVAAGPVPFHELDRGALANDGHRLGHAA